METINHTKVKNYYNVCYKTDIVGKVSPFKIQEGVRSYYAYEYVLNSLNIENIMTIRTINYETR